VSKPKVQRWECETNEFGDSDMQKNNIGNYVRYEDYARLKSEVEKWEKNTQLMGRQLNDELEQVARLKAEVERLTERNQFLEQIDSYLQEGINIENEERCIELEAQVERLTKAGDAMASLLQFDETLNDSDHIPQSVQAWNAAKGGKQP
jgi:hypothetical protein